MDVGKERALRCVSVIIASGRTVQRTLGGAPGTPPGGGGGGGGGPPNPGGGGGRGGGGGGIAVYIRGEFCVPSLLMERMRSFGRFESGLVSEWTAGGENRSARYS
jgi:hypothetical protein